MDTRTNENPKKKPLALMLGGSFNPPTKAHIAVLEEAMERTGATLGILVPSSDAYVRRKASRQNAHVFSERERLEMLEAYAEGKPDITVSQCEYGDTSKGRTYKSLCELQRLFPEHAIAFLTGADKLGILARWPDAPKLLRDFPVAVTARDGNDATDKSKLPPVYRDATLLPVSQPDEASGISSSMLQRLLREGDPSAERIMCPKAYAIARRSIDNAKAP